MRYSRFVASEVSVCECEFAFEWCSVTKPGRCRRWSLCVLEITNTYLIDTPTPSISRSRRAVRLMSLRWLTLHAALRCTFLKVSWRKQNYWNHSRTYHSKTYHVGRRLVWERVVTRTRRIAFQAIGKRVMGLLDYKVTQARRNRSVWLTVRFDWRVWVLRALVSLSFI